MASKMVQSSHPTALMTRIRTYIRRHTITNAAVVTVATQAMKPGARDTSPPGGSCESEAIFPAIPLDSVLPKFNGRCYSDQT